MTYATIADVRSANKNAGLHFFNADTMRFFAEPGAEIIA